MTVRLVVRGALCLSLLAANSMAWAGGGWHNPVTRRLGIWYSDGYHSHEGCADEKVGGWKRSGHGPHSGGAGYADYQDHASPFADQYRSRAPRPMPGGAMYDERGYDGIYSNEPLHGEPTPAMPKAPVAPTIPSDPSTPMSHGHSEARLPSSMFRLAPLR